MKAKAYNLFKVAGEYAAYGVLFFLAISNALVEIFVAGMFLSFIGRKIIKPDFKFLKSWPNAFLLLFLFFNALSLFNSGLYFDKSLHALFGKWMQYLGICIILQDGIYEEKVVKRGIFVFLFGAALAVFSGLSQYFFNFEFLRNRNTVNLNNGLPAATSSFTHFNAFGGYLVVVLSLLSALLLKDSSSRFKIRGLSALGVFSTLAIIFTFSRGSWLAASVAFIFMGVLSAKNLKRLIPILLTVLVLFSTPVLYERLLLTFKVGGDSDRFRYWLAAWKMINEHPVLGMGVGTFMSNFPKFLPNSVVSYAHNCYLQIWAEAGIFSLLSFMLFAGSFIYLGVKKFLVSRDLILCGLLAGSIGFLVHSFFETNLYSLRLAVLFWVWAGLILRRIS